MNRIITYSFCDHFIDKLVDHIEQEYLNKRKDISRIAIVFGGRRPALFIQRALSQRIRKSFYPPKFLSIDEFVRYIIEKQETFSPALDLESCYLLYTLAKKVTPDILERRSTFARFLPWSREILSFMDQLDLENIGNDKLLSIQANARIGYDVPDDINQILKSMVVLRQAYQKELKDQKIYSRGYQYLRASEIVQQTSFDEFDQILFCNFFYFHRCEEQIVKDLYQRKKATLIFQGDQRKWPVLQRISEKFNCQIQEGKTPDVPQFKWNMYSGFDMHAQVGIVHDILRKIKHKDQTVIVLPYAESLIPLLSEMGTIIEDYNISMGYPLRRSSLYVLLEFLFKAQLSRKNNKYYTKDYLKVLRHPFIKNLKLSPDETITRILIHTLEDILTGKERRDISGSIFISPDQIIKFKELFTLTRQTLGKMGIEIGTKELQKIFDQIQTLLFIDLEPIHNFYSFSVYLEKFINTLVQNSFLQNYPLNLSIADRILEIKDELQQASFNQEQLSQEEIFKIFESKLTREMIAFTGSPLTGMQILGLLETRSLNFKNVIIMDVNEGILPKLRIYEPLIPREVMISLNLDRLELEEEIQRYQFMRLISSAENVHLVYQESKDKEKSRFIEELIWEEQKKIRSYSLEDLHKQVPLQRASFEVSVAARAKAVKKTPAMIKFLRNFTYSASSLNMYLINPMEFYFNYVLGLREYDDLLDEPEARHVGTFIHELLEDQYRSLLHKPLKINSAFRDNFMNQFHTKFEQNFGQGMKADSFLLKTVMQERLSRFLDKEQSKERSFTQEILCLEKHFKDTIPLSNADIKFKYVIDRIDKMQDGTIMLIDYKTGSVDLMPRAIEHIASMELSRESILEYVQSFQIPLYFYYLDKHYKNQPINAALYNLRTMELKKFIDHKMPFSREQIIAAFMRALDYIMSEILNPDINFVEDDIMVY